MRTFAALLRSFSVIGSKTQALIEQIAKDVAHLLSHAEKKDLAIATEIEIASVNDLASEDCLSICLINHHCETQQTLHIYMN